MPDIRIAPLGAVGLNSDEGNSVLDPKAITEASNVRAFDGALRSALGESELFGLEIEPLYHGAYVDIAGVQWAVVSDGNLVHLYSMIGRRVDITPKAGGLSYGTVTIESLNGVLIVNASKDGLYYYPGGEQVLAQWPGPGDSARGWTLDGSGPPSDLNGADGDYYLDLLSGLWYMKAAGTWSTSTGGVEYGWRWDLKWQARSVAAYRYYVVALGMTEDGNRYPYKVRWSTSAQEGDIPVQWALRPENEAGSDLLGETLGHIIGGEIVRDALFVIKEDSVYTCQWVGGQFVMQFTRLQGTIGTNIQGGFTEVAGQLAVLTSRDLLVFDGTTQRTIVKGKVTQALFDQLSPLEWSKSKLYFHRASGVMYVAVVKDGDKALTYCLMYDTRNDAWGHKWLHGGYGFDTATIQSISGSDNLYQTAAPNILLYESNLDDGSEATPRYWVSAIDEYNTSFDGTAKECLAERSGLPIMESAGRFLVNEVFVEAEGEGEFSLTVGASDTPSGSITWFDPPLLVKPRQDNILDPVLTGRYLAWRVRSLTKGAWALHGLTFTVEPTGRH